MTGHSETSGLTAPQRLALVFFGGTSVTTARLLTQGRMVAGLMTGPGMLLLGIALAAIGWWGTAMLT